MTADPAVPIIYVDVPIKITVLGCEIKKVSNILGMEYKSLYFYLIL